VERRDKEVGERMRNIFVLFKKYSVSMLCVVALLLSIGGGYLASKSIFGEECFSHRK